LNPATSFIHPVHPVEKSDFDLMVRIVANMIDPDRHQHTAAAATNRLPVALQ
jgi:hypothetical protein